MNTSVASNSTLLSTFTGQLPSVQNPLFTAAISINLLLGLPTNVYVLWLIVTGAGGTMASEFFTLNLALSEIFYSLSNLMYIIHDHIQENGALLSVGTFFAGFNLFGRPLFQCCICVERYLAVVHPVTFLKYKPLRYRLISARIVSISLKSDLTAAFSRRASQGRETNAALFSPVVPVLTVVLSRASSDLKSFIQDLSRSGRRERDVAHRCF
ncbi:hypothetical protein J4Q44_G00038320 [Coregonus suidteri]|uniref:G-protein coupled receptors family 1 profile domain-containing protein n=1 Tax=Coregonus suidteri TaxID=861788 RepID=A0AAN8MI88_9TELE